MRPPDEHQDLRLHAGARPNLIAPPRGGGHEDSILAKLEREPAHRDGGGNGARLAWYGTAALLALGLTAVLAWLAAGAGPAVLEMAQPGPPAPPAAAAAAPAPAMVVEAVPEPLVAPLRLLAPAVTRPAVVAPPPGAAPVASRTAPRTPARPRPARAVPPPRGTEAPEDSDVALISAVIYHANGHAAPHEEAPGAPCDDASCRPRPSLQPPW